MNNEASCTPDGNHTAPANVKWDMNKKALTISEYSANWTNGATNYTRSYSTGVGSETVTLTYTPYSNTPGTYTHSSSASSGKFTLSQSNTNYSIYSAGNFTIRGMYTVKYFNKYTKEVDRNLTLSSTGSYQWTNQGDYWQSGNYNVVNSSSHLVSEEFVLTSTKTLSFDYAASGEGGDYDYAYYTITKDGSTMSGTGTSTKVAGTATDVSALEWTHVEKELSAGTYKITFTYRKDGSINKYLDRGFVKNVIIKNGDTQTVNENTMSNSTHYIGVAKNLNTNTYTREGHVLLGWSRTDGGTTADLTDGQSVTNLSTTHGATVNLYTVWKKAYNVNITVYNGNITGSSSKTVAEGTNTTFTVTRTSGYNYQSIKCTNEQTATLSGTTLTVGPITADTTCTVKFRQYANLDESGANEPELGANMIPVYWDSSASVWKKADVNNSNQAYKWYDYDNKMWANSVTVTSTNRQTYKNAALGTTIPMSDILTMQVWLPRYKYRVWNYNSDGEQTSNPQQIDIEFETGTGTTGQITCTDSIQTTSDKPSEICTYNGTTCTDSLCNGKTYTHPAFTFGNEELTGFWMGKFEVSNSTTQIQVKPDVQSLRSKTTKEFSDSMLAMNDSGNSYGFSSSEDTHMIKNSEWGAVAYLSHSEYGTCNNGTCTEVYINNSSSNYTGRAGQTANTSTYSAQGDYTYQTAGGVKASTTGNIYGVYDMSGGARDKVMANQIKSDGTMNASSSGFSTNTYPDAKYFDKYSINNSGGSYKKASKLGDAIKEIRSDSSYHGWYSEYSVMIYSLYPWLDRGETYQNGIFTGIFASSYGYGDSGSFDSSRLSISVIDTSPKTVNVTVNNGTITGDTSKIVNYGQTTTFTVNNNAGYNYASISCTNGQTATWANGTLTTGQITSNTTCTVTFNSGYEVEVEVTRGSVSGDSIKTVAPNNATTFTINKYSDSCNGKVTCTNGQTATLSGTTLTTGPITNNTTCSVVYGKETWERRSGSSTYDVPVNSNSQFCCGSSYYENSNYHDFTIQGSWTNAINLSGWCDGASSSGHSGSCTSSTWTVTRYSTAYWGEGGNLYATQTGFQQWNRSCSQ